jgi:hypothetical protein
MKIEIVNKSHHPLPGYATPLSAGMDIRANLSEPVVLNPLDRKLIPTGLFIALSEGTKPRLGTRSGLAIKHGITLSITPEQLMRLQSGRSELSLSTFPMSLLLFRMANGFARCNCCSCTCCYGAVECWMKPKGEFRRLLSHRKALSDKNIRNKLAHVKRNIPSGLNIHASGSQ